MVGEKIIYALYADIGGSWRIQVYYTNKNYYLECALFLPNNFFDILNIFIDFDILSVELIIVFFCNFKLLFINV